MRNEEFYSWSGKRSRQRARELYRGHFALYMLLARDRITCSIRLGTLHSSGITVTNLRLAWPVMSQRPCTCRCSLVLRCEMRLSTQMRLSTSSQHRRLTKLSTEPLATQCTALRYPSHRLDQREVPVESALVQSKHFFGAIKRDCCRPPRKIV